MVHIQIQSFLQRLLPEGDCHLEVRFSEIKRIADVVWTSQKLIFEIQCSGISAEEVKQRNRDYLSLGYQVVWILHDSFFNQQRVTAAEVFLRQFPFYFTNMDIEGRGRVYDQFDIVHKGMRRHVQQHSSVDLSLPQVTKHPIKMLSIVPRFIQERLQKWPHYFKGDLIDGEDFSEILQAEKEWASRNQFDKANPLIKRVWYRFIVRPYMLLLRMLLERLCR